MKLVLASSSPRRRELLQMLGLAFEIRPAAGPENPPAGASPARTVAALSLAKALEVRGDFPQAAVIGADTVVTVDADILGKPENAADAARMLRLLSGRSHSVFTGVTVLAGDRRLTGTEETRVFFRKLSEDEIGRYIATGEPMDKAGAYACQGLASLFIERIEGDFFNVMGLPLYRLGRMLNELGVVMP